MKTPTQNDSQQVTQSGLPVTDGFCASLEWHRGPAEGGTGTAGRCEETGKHLWWNGDRLLVVVETNQGREIAVVDIEADEDYFNVRDASTGETYDAWEPESWSWWAKLTKRNLPQNANDETAGRTEPRKNS